MCKCTPEVRTPFCGKVGCDDWNDKRGQNNKESKMEECGLTKRVHNDFTYHRPPAEVQETFVQLREKAKELALLIVDKVPSGREQSSALTRLEETIFHANAGIARRYPVEKV